LKGIVKMFDEMRGFGYITGEDGNEYFVHFGAIEGEGYRVLNEGEAVEFDIVETEHGKQVNNVRRI
jgi:CspA family cold shock protein